MSSQSKKAEFRAELFNHLNGIAVVPTVFALDKAGVLGFLVENKNTTLSELTNKFNANKGYLNVALRVLCTQGWLEQRIDRSEQEIHFKINANTDSIFELLPLIEKAVHLIEYSGQFHKRKFELKPFRVLEQLMQNYREAKEKEAPHSVYKQLLKHIEGIIVGPSIVMLGKGGMFHKYFMETSFRAEEYHQDPISFNTLLQFFKYLGWFKEPTKEHYSFTEKGLFFAKRATAYGVTVSYLPTFRKLSSLLFDNPMVLWNTKPGENEKHVDREMNVWGSGGAHSTYFKVVDEMIMSIFNAPLEQQPKGVLDMGCGNGAFIKHIFELIAQHTIRGKHLEEHPLFLVGVDYNTEAIKVTKANLINADIWAKIIWGDIGDPVQLATDLMDNYKIKLEDLLNVRTFLDHNRPWNPPSTVVENNWDQMTGAYAYRGSWLPNELVAQSLKEHLLKWKPFVKKHGLLLIELHTLPPEKAAANIGLTASTAYDATHGFSDQYIVEIEVFMEIAISVGLIPDKRLGKRFPDNELATISVNLFLQN